MTTDDPNAPRRSLDDLVASARSEVEQLTRELSEIELLSTQARSEAGRHEQKRAQAAERLAALAGQRGEPDLVEANDQLLALTRRAAFMEAQVDLLDGKRKAVVRFLEAKRRYSETLDAAQEALEGGLAALEGGVQVTGASEPAVPGEIAGRPQLTPSAPGLSRAILTAQEDLRRDIARAMHDGPAQSLTNIVLQAQIVEHLMSRDPAMAATELRQLVAMVQQTLEATKAFIFEVRPMVLDDLGLVPTLRRTARDRGRRSQIPIEFESLGTDRRLPMDLESGLFRILDEAVAGYLSEHPDRVAIRLDWAEPIEARVSASRTAGSVSTEVPEPEPGKGNGKKKDKAEKRGEEMPAALAAMIAEQREGAARAAEAAQTVALPATIWREIQQRAATLGVRVALRGGGRELHLVVDAPPPE